MIKLYLGNHLKSAKTQSAGFLVDFPMLQVADMYLYNMYYLDVSVIQMSVIWMIWSEPVLFSQALDKRMNCFYFFFIGQSKSDGRT